jgi:hypothetical protein
LPWCNLLVKENSIIKPDLKILLKERLDLKYTRKLFSMIPRELNDILKKVLTLGFDEVPNYAAIREALASSAIKHLVKKSGY